MPLEITWNTEATVELPEGGDAIRTTSEVLELDIVVTDTYEVAAKISTHAVEQGVDITDHTEPEQDRVQVQAAISGRPMTINQVEGTTVEVINLPNGGKATAIKLPEGTTRRADAFAELRNLNRTGTLVNVEGLIRPLENYQIETVTAPRAVEDAGLLVVDIVFVEHRTAEVEEVNVPSPRVERGRNSTNRGRQTNVIGAGVGGGVNAEGIGAGAGGTIRGQEDVSSDPSDRSNSTSTLRNMLGSPSGASQATGTITDDWQPRS
jgi:hypothetical protein